VLDCAIIYIKLIIAHNGDVSPENDPHFSSWYQSTNYNSVRDSIWKLEF